MAFFSCLVYSNGLFSCTKATVGYYSMFGLLVIFNVIFNHQRPSLNRQYIFGVSFNSICSVLTYNNFSFRHLEVENEKGQKKEDLHLPTLIKQAAYMVLMFLINIGDSGFWEREDGTPFNFWAILTAGWVGFFMSILLNVVLYKVHPSGVPFSLSHPKKMVVHVFGKEYKLRKTSEDAKADEECGAEGIEDQEDVAPAKTGRSCFLKSSCCYGRNEEESGDERVQPRTKRSCFSSKCCGGGGNEEGAVEESIQLQPQGVQPGEEETE